MPAKRLPAKFNFGKPPPKPETPEEESPAEEETPEQAQAKENALNRLLNPNYAEEFVQKLAPDVRRRVQALQGLQKDHDEIHQQFIAESKALLKKYHDLAAPLFTKRDAIVTGKAEPTDEEVAISKPEEFLSGFKQSTQTTHEHGIPEFWLHALKNNEYTGDMITDRDEECLKHLTSLDCTLFEDPTKGFTLSFHFSENDFFTNTVLTKVYHLLDEDTEIVLDKAEGCEIEWKQGKNLTVVLKKKKQRHKGGKNVRTVTKEEPCDSFFNFFKPPQLPAEEQEEEEEDALDELEELIEADYEVGCVIKEKIIPRAVEWYAGLAANSGAEGSDDEGEDEEDEDEDEEDEKPQPKKPQQKKQGVQPKQEECKQQ
eukprot:TRINITY_DN1285_c0_g1_i1.p1 TRINITY_DN1285_c0_g1~~TRINITY_DN1285_c0_g1_i1.p1  ORF type:complete len:371 (-),score=99.70 TRINITY_DN1285_c0_g1_i1:45-1157(-)